MSEDLFYIYKIYYIREYMIDYKTILPKVIYIITQLIYIIYTLSYYFVSLITSIGSKFIDLTSVLPIMWT